jgi:hypothetical protein
MDHDKALKEKFAHHFRLKERTHTLPSRPALEAMRQEILQTEPPGLPHLTPEQRQALGGQRLPAPREFLRRLAEALEKHPEISRDTHVTPTSCRRTAALYNAANQLIEGTGNAHEACQDALRICNHRALAQGRAVLEAVHRMILSGKAPAGLDPVTLEVLFDPAFAAYERATQARRETAEEETASGDVP